MFNMVQAYCAKDRVPTLHLNDDQPDPEIIKDIALEKYLPTEEEEERLKDEMLVIIKRILVEVMPAFKPLHDEVIWHIQHPYSDETSKKSEMV